jgi:membrane fusion protein, heavy metal efflux system
MQPPNHEPLVVAEKVEMPPLVERLKRWRPTRRDALSVGAAVLVSVASIFASAHFRRKPPPPPVETKDVHVTGDQIAIAPGAPQWRLVKLGKAVASKERWSDPVPAHVAVDEALAVRVGAPLGGRVVRVFVELGQPVKAGDALLSVASPDLAALNAERAKAKVELDTAESALSRIQAIVQARALPEKEEVAAIGQLRQAQVDYRVAQAKLASLRVATSSDNEFVVKSPRSGTVVEKNVLPGQEVAPGADGSLMMVADLSSVWVVAELFESDAAGIEVGTQARITVSSAPGKVFDGRVDMVSAVVDPERHSVPVRVQLENPDGALKPNTYARMEFLAKSPPGSVEIDSSAVVNNGVEQYVYVQEAGRMARRAVVVGPVRAGRALILSGLKPGETVVERGAILLDNQIALSE